MRYIILLLFSFIVASTMEARDKSVEFEKIEQIRKQPDKYFFGQASEHTERLARRLAQEDMARMIEVRLVLDEKIEMKEGKESFESHASFRSNVFMRNIKEISYTQEKDGEKVQVVFVYISKTDYDKFLEQERQRLFNKVVSFIKEGRLQEEKVNIADALRYFNWALNMSRNQKINDKIDITDNREVQFWLEDKIKSILKNVKIGLATEQIDYNPRNYDKYTVNLLVTYANRPVSSLDIRYWTGTDNIDVMIKNGEAALKFPSLDGVSSINTKIHYSYDSDEDLDEDLRFVYEMTPKKNFDELSTKEIPVKINKDFERVRVDGKMARKKDQESEKKNDSNSINPQVNNLREEVERIFISDNEKVNQMLIAATEVENALRQGKKGDELKSINNFFTIEGFESFQRLINSGEITVSRSKGFTFEDAGHYIRCKSIPVSVKNGKHQRNENVILRFDPDSHLISSISYALTDVAENDIFHSSEWTLSARYTILKFMEDYQTAFALKDRNYIDGIYSGDAIIITGKIPTNGGYLHNKENLWRDYDGETTSVVDGILYTQHTKQSYMNHLKKIFHYNPYVYLTFFDTKISKAYTDEEAYEVYWVQLKQDHNSTSYSDKGYLTLQISVRPEGSIIFVRTWTPSAIDLNEMKKRYPVN